MLGKQIAGPVKMEITLVETLPRKTEAAEGRWTTPQLPAKATFSSSKHVYQVNTGVSPPYFYFMCLCTTCVQYPPDKQDSTGPTGTGVTDSCELQCGCWERNPSPQEE
ncbi:hypothetical protein STEG23_034618, partial [Scotinomys teguina]